MIRILLVLLLLCTPAYATSTFSCYDLNDTSFYSAFNGVDGATTATEVTGKTLTFNDNAQIDTAQSKFGGASLLGDGTNDYVSTGDDADFDLGTGDFTLQAWVRFAVYAPTTYAIFGQWNDNTDQQAWFMQQATANSFRFVWTNDGATLEFLGVSWTPVINTWYHVAIVRNGADLMFFIDGTQTGTTQNIGTEDVFDSSFNFRVSSIVNSAGSTIQAINGWIDDPRVTKGRALWISNFTPPTAAPIECKETVMFGTNF